MRPSDALIWHMERDPELRSTVVAVAWLESAPAWEDLARRTEWATRQVPSFRRRPVEVPGRLSTPRWTTDPHFEVAWHLRRVDVPAPHGRDEVLALAALAAMSGFDRTRPLWEFTLVEGLEGGRAAVIMKMHHSLTDGIGGVQLALALFDAEADGTRGRRPAARGATRRMGPGPPAGPGGAGRPRRPAARRRPGGGAAAFRARPARVVRHPMGTGADVVETARSIGRTVRPLPAVLSPVMTDAGPDGSCTPSPSAWTS